MNSSLIINQGLDSKGKLIDTIHCCKRKRSTLGTLNFDDMVKIIWKSEVYELEKGFLIITLLDGLHNISLVSKEFMFVSWFFNNIESIVEELHVQGNKYYIEFTNEKLYNLFKTKYRFKLKKFYVKEYENCNFVLTRRD